MLADEEVKSLQRRSEDSSDELLDDSDVSYSQITSDIGNKNQKIAQLISVYMPEQPQLFKFREVESKKPDFIEENSKSTNLLKIFMSDDDNHGDWLANLKYILEDSKKKNSVKVSNNVSNMAIKN